ncbi:hypothetical protein R2F61_04735 [Mollicutes bacterium LVI A0078]|nr:hypothetical protein RZE84_04755 [Mollicutes bacterium LVI A0075]WOO91850.1 hypothetical protein R2F61_04735 [Mollicutes bacterium LVI A0078]
MNTKRSHKIFSLVMLILIVATVVATAILSAYNVYEYKQQQKLQEAAYAAIEESASEEA